MTLTITLLDRAGDLRLDVDVSASPDTPAAEVGDALRHLVRSAAGTPLVLAGRLLAENVPVAEWGLADGDVVEVGGVPAPPASVVSEVVVTAGPDAGRRAPLFGQLVVGRDPSLPLTVHDPGVSRRHLRLASGGVVTAGDLGSRNGTVVINRVLRPTELVPLPHEEPVRLGDSELVVRRVTPRRSLHPGPDGHVTLQPAASCCPPAPDAPDLTPPVTPAEPVPVRLPWLAAAAPLVAGVGMAWWLGQWQLLGFTALAPILLLGQALGDRRARRQQRTADLARYETQAAALADRRDRYAAELVRHRHATDPDLGRLTAAAAQRGVELWSRPAEELRLRLGRGPLTGPQEVELTDVPVCVSLRDHRVLALTGPRQLVDGLGRSLVVQAATMHPPSQLQIACLAPGRSPAWGWVRWLPHNRCREPAAARSMLGFDSAQVAQRLAELAAAPHDVLVVIDASTAVHCSPQVAALLASPARVLWLASDARHPVPASCTAVAELVSGSRLELRAGPQHTVVRPDLVAADVAEQTARLLAPLRDAAAVSRRLPERVGWSALTGVGLASAGHAARDLERAWRASPSLRLALGAGSCSAATVDLIRDGPHVLVAGRTGSGKSELLRSLVAGLVAANRPDQLNLLLVDYKGGAAFGLCSRLPHTVGVLTDLEPASTARALVSLRAELRRREQLFAETAAADLEQYAAQAVDPPARLVIVVDEFATLAEEHPDLLSGLVGIAQRGRSLGVHLVLATQRPHGVISPEIRANTSVRLCLAVTREEESRDVIGGPQAAAISHHTPGRGFLQLGAEPPQQIQVATLGEAAGTAAPLVALSPVEAAGTRSASDAGPTPDTGLAVLVAAVEQAARATGCRPADPLWLPPLPEQLALSALARGSGRIGFGLVDRPAERRQDALDVTGTGTGGWLIVGAARSGRTTAVRALLLATAATRAPQQVTFWALTSDPDEELAALPHCGGMVPMSDLEQVDRLLRSLRQLTAERRRSPQPDSSLDATAAAGPAGILVIDSWESLVTSVGDCDGGRLLEVALHLLVTGPGAGLQVVVTGGRGALVGRLAASLPDKLVLRLADPTDYALIGATGRELPRQPPPGRGLRSWDRAAVQVAAPDEEAWAAARRWPAADLLLRIASPPDRVPLPQLLRAHPADSALLLGMRVDLGAPARLDRAEVGGSILVAGPPRSGRSSLLVTIGTQLRDAPVAVVCTRRSPLLSLTAAHPIDPSDQAAAAGELEALAQTSAGAAHVLVDDVELLGDGPVAAWLEQAITAGREGGRIVAMAGTTEALSVAFHGPVRAARQRRTGALLCPEGSRDGEVVGARGTIRAVSRQPVGRGWLAAGGETVPVQFAVPSPAGQA